MTYILMTLLTTPNAPNSKMTPATIAVSVLLKCGNLSLNKKDS